MKFIYLIRSEINGEILYKIGITKNINERKKQLQTANTDLTVVDFFESKWANKIESYLHNVYKSYNVSGEWFLLDFEDVKKFKERCEKIEKNYDYLSEHNPFFKK